MVKMMSLLDADGDGRVSKLEFGVYYKQLKSCTDTAFEAAWKEIDQNGDGELTLNELCDYYGVARDECAAALKAHTSAMDDNKILEALQLQGLLNAARLKQEQQQRLHAERLRALAALVDEEEDEEDEAASSPTTAKAASPASPGISMEQLIRESKRRGDLAPHHFERT